MLLLYFLKHWFPIFEVLDTSVGFPSGSAVKNLPASAGDVASVPGS